MSYYPPQSCYNPCRPRAFSSGSSQGGYRSRIRYSTGSCYGGYGQGICYVPSCGYGYGGYRGQTYGRICYQPQGYGYSYGYGNRYCPPLWCGGYGSGGYDYGCRSGGLYGRRKSICYDPCYGPRYQYGSRRGSYSGPC